MCTTMPPTYLKEPPRAEKARFLKQRYSLPHNIKMEECDVVVTVAIDVLSRTRYP